MRQLDLRPGGQLLYAMTATAPEQVAFMRQAGMPLTTEAKVTYTEVTPLRRLGYTILTDFVPGVKAYDVATLVELEAVGDHVRMTVNFDPMHDDVSDRTRPDGPRERARQARRPHRPPPSGARPRDDVCGSAGSGRSWPASS